MFSASPKLAASGGGHTQLGGGRALTLEALELVGDPGRRLAFVETIIERYFTLSRSPNSTLSIHLFPKAASD